MPYRDKEVDKARRSDPEYRARLNARNREKYNTDPEYRAKVNERNAERLQKRRAEDPEYQAKVNEYKRQWKWRDTLKERYGISPEEYDALYVQQDGKCAICRKPILNAQGNGQKEAKQNYQTCVDHDHADGHVRGLLCWHCNTGLGHFKDNTDTLRNAIAYLERG